MATKLVILGTGPYAAEIADIAEEIGDWEVDAFIAPSKIDIDTIIGKPLVVIDEAQHLAATHKAVCAQVSTQRHEFIAKASNLGFSFATVIHPAAYVSKRNSIGEGAIIGPGVTARAYSSIGNHTILISGAVIGHHVEIGDYVTVAAGVVIAGSARIGPRTFIGVNATILPERIIGSSCTIGAGSLVTRDVPDGVQVVGSPARITKAIKGV